MENIEKYIIVAFAIFSALILCVAINTIRKALKKDYEYKRKDILTLSCCILIFCVISGFFFLNNIKGEKLVNLTYLTETQTILHEIEDTKLTNEEREDKLLDLLDTQIYKAAETEVPYTLTEELDAIFRDVENPTNEYIIKKANSECLKGFVKDLDKEYFKIIKDPFFGYTVVVDFAYFEEDLKDKLPENCITYLAFREKANAESLFDDNNECYDISKTVERIDYIEKIKDNDEKYKSSYEEFEDTYYEILRGEVLNYHLDYNNEYLTAYAQREYEKIEKRDDEVGKIAREILAVYGK